MSLQYQIHGPTTKVMNMSMLAFFKMTESMDQDLKAASESTARLYAEYFHVLDDAPLFLKELLHLLIGSGLTWHAKLVVLQTLQIFFFRHIFLLPEDQVLDFIKSLKSMLYHSQIEIRNLAAETLAGVLRCVSPLIQRDLEVEFLALLFETTISKKRSREPVEQETYNQSLIKRHGIVLGLCAIVQSSPYTITEGMPALLTHISTCINDPAPISV
jgi:proteasome activator subunit 4